MLVLELWHKVIKYFTYKSITYLTPLIDDSYFLQLSQ